MSQAGFPDVSLCSLDTAALLLSTLDSYEVAHQRGAHGGRSLAGRRYDRVLGQVDIRLAIVGEFSSTELTEWIEADPSDLRLRLLIRDGSQREHATQLVRQTVALGRVAHVQAWNEFFADIVQLSVVEDHYRTLSDEYYETEGASFVYVDQSAVIEDRTERLLEWALSDGADSGVTYVVAEYGEGKSSFCLNYLFAGIQRARQGGPVPLLFNLNEHEAGNLAAFVENQLLTEYSLPLSFVRFRELCRRGVFVPVFDAFDQMHNGEGGTVRIERDHGHLMELRSEVSPLFVTCRMNFFEQHVSKLRERDEFRVATLRGFDEADVRKALGGESSPLADLLGDPANQPVLANIHLKPLMLHVILRHVDVFTDLLARRRKEAADSELRVITEYEVFNLLYTAWLEDTSFEGLGSQRVAARVVRDIASRVQLDGMNQAVPLSYLRRRANFAGMVATRDALLAVRNDLRQLPLLNRPLLRREEPKVAFRFNAYLEFITARTVLEELTPERAVNRELVRQNPLTWETRQMLAPSLRVDTHGPSIRRIVDEARNEPFYDVKFGAGNVVTLILDCAHHARVSPSDRESWRAFLRGLSLQGVVLRRLDARGADLSGMNFSGADLGDADFSFAVLRDTNLSETQLAGANFQEAGAVLTSVFVTQAINDPDRWRLAGGTENGIVVLWDSSSSHPTRTHLHRDAVKALGAVRRDGRVVSAALDGWLGEIDPASPHVPLGHPLSVGGLRAMAVSDDGDVVVGGDRRTLLVLDRAARERHRLELPEGRRAVITALAIDREHDALLAGDSDGDIYAFPTWRRATLGNRIWADVGGEVRALTVMRNGALLALVDGVGAMYLADGEAPDLLDSGRPMVSVSYAPDADTIVWHDGIRVWTRKLEPGASPVALANLPADIGEAMLSCSPDASFVAVGGNRIVVWRDGFHGLEMVLDEPMRMDCTGAILADCEGLSPEHRAFLTERGGLFDLKMRKGHAL